MLGLSDSDMVPAVFSRGAYDVPELHQHEPEGDVYNLNTVHDYSALLLEKQGFGNSFVVSSFLLKTVREHRLCSLAKQLPLP